MTLPCVPVWCLLHILNTFVLTSKMRIAQHCFFFLPHPNEWFKDQNLITSLYRTKWIIRPSGYRLQRKGMQQSQEQEDLWSWSQRILNCGALELLQSHNCFKSLLIGEVAQCTHGLRAESEHCWKMLGPGSDCLMGLASQVTQSPCLLVFPLANEDNTTTSQEE